MNTHNLILSLGSIDDKYIIEAAHACNKHTVKKHTILKGLYAACLLCCIVISATIVPKFFKSPPQSINTVLKGNGFSNSSQIFDHSISISDNSNDESMPPNIGEGSDGYSRTKILKNPLTNLHLIEYPDFSLGDKLAVYKTVTPTASDESVKARHDTLISALGFAEASQSDAAISTSSEGCCITELPSSDDANADNVITIHTEARFSHVRYTISGLTDNLENPDYIAELINDPYVKSACECIGITNPAYTYSVEYNITGIPSLYCMIYDASNDPGECAVRARQQSVIISSWYSDDVSLTVYNSDSLVFDGYYDAIDINEAAQICIDRYGINVNDIAAVGFDACLLLDASNRFAPCYVFYVHCDSEYISYYNMDATVFQEYLVINVPAVK